MRKEQKRLLSIVLFGVLMMVYFVGCGLDTTATSTAETKVQALASYDKNNEATNEQNEAAKSAVNYIETCFLSKTTLLNQLVEFEDYSTEAAQYAVDNITVDWNEVALALANNYFKVSHFSKQGLYDQLTSEYGEAFTPEEAQYAVNNVDVDWKEQALGAARSYLKTGSFSQQGLYNQLTSAYADNFTEEGAQYALDNIDADWNAEALEAAENYYNMGMTDKTEIYNQITSTYADQFTAEQAQYAIDHLDPAKLDAN